MADWTTKELADKAGVSQPFIRQEIADGRLHAVKRGRDWLITAAEAQRWLDNPRRGTRRPAKQVDG